ncbi:MAG: hypothetical protein SGJ20_03040 [Planctomycetota bacterium]|nr:hypothetical protein [Planctomycetota bacterium]
MKHLLAILCLFVGLTCGAAMADTIRRIGGTIENGTLAKMTRDGVRLTSSTKDVTVPVNEILTYNFTREPNALKDVRSAIESQQYEKVPTIIEAMPMMSEPRPEVTADLEFYRALAAVRLAISGVLDQKETLEAGKAMIEFLKAHPDNYHFYEANEAVGNLLASMNNPQAPRYYDIVASAPWNDYKVRALVLKGRAEQMLGKHQSAVQQFDAALKLPPNNPNAEEQLKYAQVYRAASMAEIGQAQQGLIAIKSTIDSLDTADQELLARAYNALGTCYLKLNQPADARFAYLHVDLLFSSQADAHAETLHQLISLWKIDKKPERAKAAAETLQELYPGSRWSRVK